MTFVEVQHISWNQWKHLVQQIHFSPCLFEENYDYIMKDEIECIRCAIMVITTVNIAGTSHFVSIQLNDIPFV